MLSLYGRQLLIPDYLFDVIEGVQKKGFEANIPSLKKRRDDLCAKYMDRIRVLINYFLFFR